MLDEELDLGEERMVSVGLGFPVKLAVVRRGDLGDSHLRLFYYLAGDSREREIRAQGMKIFRNSKSKTNFSFFSH